MRADELHIPVVISIVMPTEQKVLPGGCLMPCWSAVTGTEKSLDRRGDENGNPQTSDTVQPGAPLYGLESHMQGKSSLLVAASPSGVTENCLAGLHQRR